MHMIMLSKITLVVLVTSFVCKFVDLLAIYIHITCKIKTKLLSLIVGIGSRTKTGISKEILKMKGFGLILSDLIGWAVWLLCVRVQM